MLVSYVGEIHGDAPFEFFFLAFKDFFPFFSFFFFYIAVYKIFFFISWEQESFAIGEIWRGDLKEDR